MVKMVNVFALFLALCGVTRLNASATNIAFLGDSWMAGVGATSRCYPRVSMSSAGCAGTAIADEIARMLGATSYQNLSLGGAFIIDGITNEAPLVDPGANVVIIDLGFNDEKPLGDLHDLFLYWNACDPATRSYFPSTIGNAFCGFSEPSTASAYNTHGFSEIPSDIATRLASVIAITRDRTYGAKIFLVSPQRVDEVPNQWNQTQLSEYYPWSTNIVRSAVMAQYNNVAGIVDLSAEPIYDPSMYISFSALTCPTPGEGPCPAHPNDQGASAIAEAIASYVKRHL